MAIRSDFISSAAGQAIAPSKAQADAVSAYDAAVSRFKAVLRQRRAQIDSKQPLPDLPGQGTVPRAQRHAEYVQRSHMRLAVKNRQAEQIQDSTGLFRRRQRTAARRIWRPVQDHAGAAGECAKFRYAI
jgi:hypothetical protein